MAEAGAWQRERRIGGALLVAVLIVGVLLLAGRGSHHRSATTSTTAAGGTPNTELFTNVSAPDGPITTATAPPAPASTAAVTVPPASLPAVASVPAAVSSAPATLTGRVLDPAGRPEAGAYVIGLQSGSVTRTDASGAFTLTCPHEPLMASAWLPTLRATASTGTPPPTGQPLGYVFTGGPTAAAATVPDCGLPLTLTLPPAATLHVTFPEGSAPGSMAISAALPGLAQAAAPIRLDPGDGDAVLSGLDAGAVTLAASPGLTCDGGASSETGPGMVTVPLVAGQTASVSCW